MNRIKPLVLSVFITSLMIQNTVAQDKGFEPEKEFRIGFGYFGETIMRPGIALTIDYPLIQTLTNKEIQKKNGIKYKNCAFLMGAEYWNYRQPVSHVGNAIEHQTFFRFSRSFSYKKKVRIIDLGFSWGFGWNRLMGKVYKPEGNSFKQIGNRQGYFTYGIFASFGNSLFISKDIPLQWYVKPKMFIETPYAPFPQIHLAIETGVNYPINKLIKK